MKHRILNSKGETCINVKDKIIKFIEGNMADSLHYIRLDPDIINTTLCKKCSVFLLLETRQSSHKSLDLEF